MHTNSAPSRHLPRRTLVSIAVAAALASSYTASSFAGGAPVSVNGVVAGSYFTAPVNTDNPATSIASSTVASVYQGAKVCFDLNNNGVCDAGEPSTISKSDGSFLLSSATAAPLVAEISTAATNNGHTIKQRTVFRVAADQVAASIVVPLMPAAVAVTPLSTEVLRMMEADGLAYQPEKAALAQRLGVPVSTVLSNPNKVTDSAQRSALLAEDVILTDRSTLAAAMVDREDVSPAALALNANATGPAITLKEAQQAVMSIEGIPRYDHIFIIMLENKATSSIAGSIYAPKINAYLNTGNQFTSYFATGNPSEPNYTALGGADDWGITDDNQWNCGATGANAVQDLPVPDKTQPGLASSPFSTACTQATNHNIVGRVNLFNALTSKGMTWRTYAESMNPGQDVRTDSVADGKVTAKDHVYPPGTLGGNASQIGSSTLNLTVPAGLYKTKHHPGMAYQNVRSAPEFKASNRTLGGGQFDSALAHGSTYAVPSNYDFDQFGTDLQAGNIGNLNFVVPDQCDDMHGISVSGTDSATGTSGTASDCGGSAIITRGDNYTDSVIKKIQASPIWTNPSKRVAIIIMFDEGTATAGFNSCCGWNPGSSTVAKPLVQNPDGTFSVDGSVANYTQGNRGHGESIFGVLTNQAGAPKGIKDSDVYSHFSFVRTLQDMFGLADPDVAGSYMNRSRYTEKFIAANLLNLPEYAGSADTHFDAVRPMNHAYVIPANYTAKQSSDVKTAPQVGPDANQVNVWSLK
ncbi:MAG: hypothetical protein QOD56_558 [Gammaproteobacteria bacterium]|jgi:hypothetical protein|nr:hypothetical protein [Gammaproteobacteria bacterium]